MPRGDAISTQQATKLVVSRYGSKQPVLSKSKGLSYSTTADQIYAISSSSGESATKEGIPNAIEVENTGDTPIMIMAGYQEYSSDTAEAGNPEFLHILLRPNEVYSPPIQAVWRSGSSKDIMDGTAVSNQTPDSNMYVDSGADVDSATAAVSYTHLTLTTTPYE